MFMNNNLKNIFMYFILINIIQIVITQYSTNLEGTLELNYTHSLSLFNGNTFILHKNGVLVYNYNFTIILYNNNFGGVPLISSEKENNLTSIIQCDDDLNQYVITIIYDKIYVFSSRGQYLFHVTNTLFTNFPTEGFNYTYFSFIYYKNENSIYYFIFSYINSQKSISLIKFQINMEEQSFDINTQNIYTGENIISDTVSCQIISSSIFSNKLACFYVNFNSSEFKNNIFFTLFDQDNDFKIINKTLVYPFYGSQGNYLIKSIIGKDKAKTVITYTSFSDNNLNYLVFDFDLFKNKFAGDSFACSPKNNLINLYYFNYLNEYILICIKDNTISINKILYSSDLAQFSTSLSSLYFNNCTYFLNYDIIFLIYEGKFNLISNFICNLSTTQIFNFPVSLRINQNTYTKPSTEPDSFYLYVSTFPTTKQYKTTTPTTSPKNIMTTIPAPQIKTTINNIIPTTIPKQIKTTIITTIPQFIKTTIPKYTKTTISTTIPIITTIIKNIKTTIPKYIKTTIPTTILKKIVTTIITTIPTTQIKENIITTIPINAQTTVPTTKINKSFISSILKSIIQTTTIHNQMKTSIITIIPTNTHTIIRTEIYPTTLINKILTTIPTTIIYKTVSLSTSIKELNNCQLKCSTCNAESKILQLCIDCNKKGGYYPSINNGIDYYECFNQETKPSNYFFNKITKFYEPCYSKCKTCNYQGNDDINNCTLCKNGYRFRPDEINTTNCVTICDFYYYISFDQYFCTDNNQCPLIANLLIRNKAQCIENCNDDNEYKFQFNYECYKECPDGTEANEKNICEVKNKKKCYLYSDYFLNVNYNSLVSSNFETLIKRYINGFNNTDFHVDYYQSQNYTITIYKTMECLKELEMTATIIDFGECYQKIKEEYNLTERNLIILIADFFNENKLIYTLFYFFNPDTGEELSIDEICKEESFTIEKSLSYYQNLNIKQAKFFEEQDINVFNSSDIFYNDLCYYFESPNGKDVPLKERLKLFFPNITFCEDGCENIGVNLTSMKAICECKLKDLLSETKDASRLFGLDYSELIESISLSVIKCYKTLFQIKYIIRCYGGFITIFLIIAQTICVIIAGKISMYKIRKITFWIVNNYSKLLRSQSIINFPPKKQKKVSKPFIFSENSNSQNETKYKLSQKSINSPLKTKNDKVKLSLFDNKNLNKKIKLFTVNEKRPNKKYSKILKKKLNLKKSNSQNNSIINLEEYLMTSLDDLDYDEAINRENRNFCRIFLDKLIVSQMIVNLFYHNNWIIPKSIKFIFFIVRIDLYIVVNALFYNEEYITDLYYSEEEEKFFSFVPRSLNRIIYTSIVSSVLDFIISLLFPTEHKIKKIIIRKRKNIKEMKRKLLISMRNIINNYWIFIIISYILTVISWYYISCFNNAYPYLKMEWIKSSIFILILIQLISIVGCFLFSLLRFISIKCKSDKIFRISNYLFS